MLIYIILRVAIAGISPAVAVQAAILPPIDYRLLSKQLLQVVHQPASSVTPTMIELAQRAGIASPLSYEPLFIAAKAAEQRGNLTQAIRLLEEVRRRRPSHSVARMQLLTYYAQSGSYAQALEELDVALRLNERLRLLMLPHLTKLLSSREGREALADVLAREPTWRQDFVGAASDQKLNPRETLALLELVRAKKKGGNVDLERRLHMQSLMAAGNYQGARSFWLSSLPASEQRLNARVTDGGFRGLAGAESFVWSLKELDVGRAELGREGGRGYLAAAYFGGRIATLAEQVLALPPGRHRLSMRAMSESGAGSNQMSWIVSCLPDGPEMLTLNLQGLTNNYSPISGTFIVPSSGCRGQRLSLVARPGDVASEVSVRISNMEIGQ